MKAASHVLKSFPARFTRRHLFAEDVAHPLDEDVLLLSWRWHLAVTKVAPKSLSVTDLPQYFWPCRVEQGSIKIHRLQNTRKKCQRHAKENTDIPAK